jgi:hypothetical protein
VQKWNRPVDATTQTPKAFGFVTYEYGINALRCMNVLPYIDIDGAPLQLKASTKEQAALDALTEVSRLRLPYFGYSVARYATACVLESHK